MNNLIELRREITNSVNIPEDILNDSKISLQDFIGFATINRFTSFPLIRGETISSDLKRITIPEDLVLEKWDYDHLHIYIFKEKLQ